MSEKVNIEVDTFFLEDFFQLGDMQVPAIVDIDNLNQVLKIVKNKLDTAASLKNIAPAPSSGFSGTNPSSGAAKAPAVIPKNPKSVLVVDDLGIVTVQLESVLKKLGFQVTISKELFDAIEKYKAQDFGYAVVDLFIPTEREGFILIDEIKKLSLLCKLNTKIIVMSASTKKEHKEKCLNRGADSFVEKSPGWQNRIADICMGKSE